MADNPCHFIILEHVRKPSFVARFQNFERKLLKDDEDVIGITARSPEEFAAEILKLQQNMGFLDML